MKNTNPVLVAMISGFVGGIAASTLVLLYLSPKSVTLEHVLSWPFLTFILIGFIVSVFYVPLKGLLSRGNLTFKWGDKEIAISEIGENIDQEISSQLDDQLSHVAIEGENETVEVIENIKKTFKIDGDNLAKTVYHLGNSSFKWRNLRTLTRRTGMSEEDIEALISSYPDLVKRSIGKTGNVIFRLRKKKKQIFDKEIGIPSS